MWQISLPLLLVKVKKGIGSILRCLKLTVLELRVGKKWKAFVKEKGCKLLTIKHMYFLIIFIVLLVQLLCWKKSKFNYFVVYLDRVWLNNLIIKLQVNNLHFQHDKHPPAKGWECLKAKVPFDPKGKQERLFEMY